MGIQNILDSLTSSIESYFIGIKPLSYMFEPSKNATDAATNAYGITLGDAQLVSGGITALTLSQDIEVRLTDEYVDVEGTDKAARDVSITLNQRAVDLFKHLSKTKAANANILNVVDLAISSPEVTRTSVEVTLSFSVIYRST